MKLPNSMKEGLGTGSSGRQGEGFSWIATCKMRRKAGLVKGKETGRFLMSMMLGWLSREVRRKRAEVVGEETNEREVLARP